jgi:hypothetical protein
MIDDSNIFDLYDIVINELIGDVMLSILVFLVVVWFLSIKAKMPYQLSILFGVLLLTIFFAETQILIIWVFVVLIVGLMFYYAVSKAMK